jgi:hypothetical protein
MDGSVVFIGTFRIPDYPAWREAIEEMSHFVSAHVPGVRRFHAYVDEGNAVGTVLYVHPDADSFDQHLATAAELIRRGTETVHVLRVELLGAPHPETVERLRASGVPVFVKSMVTGFSRATSPRKGTR